MSEVGEGLDQTGDPQRLRPKPGATRGRSGIGCDTEQIDLGGLGRL
jgi:hypothetical protein